MPNSDNSRKHLNKLASLMMIVSFLGFVDAVYLSVTRYFEASVPCTLTHACDVVLRSDYSTLLGVPVVSLGAIYYLFILFGAYIYLEYGSRLYFKITAAVTAGGFVFSVWLTYVQAFVLKAFCQYCLLSALTSTLLFVLGVIVLFKIYVLSRLPTANDPE